MNPIRSKLQKMFGKKKKHNLTLLSTVYETYNNSQLNLSAFETSSVNHRSCCSNYCFSHYKQEDKQNIPAITHFQQNNKKQQLLQIQSQLQRYKSMNKELQEKLFDHQLLEQFYLQQLRERDQIEKELKWKLEIIGEEIRSNRVCSFSVKDMREVVGNTSIRAYSTSFISQGRFSNQF